MVRAWCIWCECGNDNHKLKGGYYWIHMDCANNLMDYANDLKSVKQMLLGIHPRNDKDKNKLEVIHNFIKDMEEFKVKWSTTMKTIRGVQQ